MAEGDTPVFEDTLSGGLLPEPPPADTGLVQPIDQFPAGFTLPGDPVPTVSGTLSPPAAQEPVLGDPVTVGGGLIPDGTTGSSGEETEETEVESCCEQILELIDQQSNSLEEVLSVLMATVQQSAQSQQQLINSIFERFDRVLTMTSNQQQAFLNTVIQDLYTQLYNYIGIQDQQTNTILSALAIQQNPIPGAPQPQIGSVGTYNVYNQPVSLQEITSSVASMLEPVIEQLGQAQSQCGCPGLDPAVSAALANVAQYIGGISGSLAELVATLPALQIPPAGVAPPGGFAAGAGIGPTVSVTGSPVQVEVPVEVQPFAGGAGIGETVPVTPSAPLPPPPPPPAALETEDWRTPVEPFHDYEALAVLGLLTVALSQLRL